MPQQHMVIPHYMGRSSEIDIRNKATPLNENYFGRQDSFSSQSPLEDVPLLLPQEANGLNFSSLDDKLNDSDCNECYLNLLEANEGR